MRRIASVCLFCLVASQPVLAGAWLRETGKGFFSFSSTTRSLAAVANSEIGIYADYGLKDWLTLGLDINETPAINGHALAFIRLPLPIANEHGKLAIELGLGGHHQGEAWRPMYRLALSWGYGFTGRFGSGWMAVDTTIEHRSQNAEPLFKFDATVGLSGSHPIRPMLQIETAIARNLPFQWSLTPSLMISRKGNSTWVVGLQRRSFGQHRTGLKIALWRQF